MSADAHDHSCPCGSGAAFIQCCGPFLEDADAPATAEQLMRSRYTAFVHRDADYLMATWHPEHRPSRLRFVPGQRWLGLRICRTESGGPEDETGIVEFVARFKVLGRGRRLHETSRFRKLEGRWYYCDGDHHA